MFCAICHLWRTQSMTPVYDNKSNPTIIVGYAHAEMQKNNRARGMGWREVFRRLIKREAIK